MDAIEDFEIEDFFRRHIYDIGFAIDMASHARRMASLQPGPTKRFDSEQKERIEYQWHLRKMHSTFEGV